MRKEFDWIDFLRFIELKQAWKPGRYAYSRTVDTLKQV